MFAVQCVRPTHTHTYIEIQMRTHQLAVSANVCLTANDIVWTASSSCSCCGGSGRELSSCNNNWKCSSSRMENAAQLQQQIVDTPQCKLTTLTAYWLWHRNRKSLDRVGRVGGTGVVRQLACGWNLCSYHKGCVDDDNNIWQYHRRAKLCKKEHGMAQQKSNNMIML